MLVLEIDKTEKNYIQNLKKLGGFNEKEKMWI